MGELRVRIDGTEHRLGDTEVHYLWQTDGRLEIGTRLPRAVPRFGYLVSEFGTWWLHTNPQRRPADLQIDGGEVGDASVPLGTTTVELGLLRRAAPRPPVDPAPATVASRPRSARWWARRSDGSPVSTVGTAGPRRPGGGRAGGSGTGGGG
ncbi:hypothetical protein, partial [Micromonospora echinofusca]